jgi:PrtD family type I secretion system ABC transporter
MKIGDVQLAEPLAHALRACKRHFMAVAGFSFLTNLLLLVPAIYMLQVYDRVLPTEGKTTLLIVTFGLAIALVTLASLDALRSRLLVRASARLDTMVSPVILRQMLSNPGAANAQPLRDFDTLRMAVASPITSALLDLPWTPLFVLVCAMLHIWFAVLAIASIVLLVVIALWHQRRTQGLMGSSSAALAMAQSAAQTAALQAPTVRALGMVDAMINRQLALRAKAAQEQLEANFAGGRYAAISRFIRLFVQSAALGLGALLAIAGEISAGAVVAGSILLGRALQPIDGLIGGWSTLGAARAALTRLSKSLDQPQTHLAERTVLPAPEGKLDVEQVSVRAGDRVLLAGVSFSCVPGEFLGVIGPSGSGKTTLAKVITGAMAPDLGTVRIDGAKRQDWDPDLLGRSIGYLPQEPTLFEGTVKENISRFAAPDAGTDIDAAAITAAKLAGIHDLVLRLPQGYDTRLGPLGAGLSAGQAQRVALARALYGDPALLVLDEPNAFLDSDGEASLVQAIQTARKRKATVIVIAHRKAIFADADRLLVLEGGRPKMIGATGDVVVRLNPDSAARTA